MLAELVSGNGASLLATTDREERRRLNKALDEVSPRSGGIPWSPLRWG